MQPRVAADARADPPSFFVEGTLTQDRPCTAHAGYQVDVLLSIRILHQLNDKTPNVIDLVSVVRPWRDPQIRILVVVPGVSKSRCKETPGNSR